MGNDFVIDNSVVMTWCFQDEANQYSDNILDRFVVSTGYVPSIWPLEVCNVLLVAERRNRIGEADSTRFISLLSELPIIVEQEPPDRIMKDIFALARKHELSSYDASYLDLAMRKGLPIATLDKKILTVAERCKVEILTDK